MTDQNFNRRHNKRMQRKKQIIDKNIVLASINRGVLLVLTGNGKGKSSSAFGMLARALGHGMKVAVVQFIKGSGSTGEEKFFRQFPEVSYHIMGEGFSWETQDNERDKLAAQAAWNQAKEILNDNSYQFVILDELNIALKNNLLLLDEVITVLQQRAKMQHVIITGRGAKQQLIDVADTVTEMKMIKHAFKAGIKAQQGIEL
jgi:cob(I)alamin adenosyltransferase